MRTAPARAPKAVDLLSPTLEPARLEDTRLIVSELVANAVEHGSIKADAGITAPPRVPDDDEVRGWGLHLVHELADRSGFEPGPPPAVWFEIDHRPL